MPNPAMHLCSRQQLLRGLSRFLRPGDGSRWAFRQKALFQKVVF